MTVVLLHGWCLDRRTWHHQVAALRRRPPGSSPTTPAGTGGPLRPGWSATLGQLGDDLAEVLREYAPAGPVVLAGHSLGGMTIMEYADRHPPSSPERVAGLLFVSTTAEGPPTPVTACRPAWPRDAGGETIGAGVLARFGAWRPHRAMLPALRPAVRWLLFGDDYEADACRSRCGFGRASLQSIGGFRASIGAQQRLDTLATLGDVPAAAMVGDRDRLTPPACAESIAGALPAPT